MSEILPDIGIHTDYTDPVRRLLGIGASPANAPAEWLDYTVTYGLGSEHGAELIRLACDTALYSSDPDGTVVWAPIHAWRALGQLQAAASVPSLLAVLKSAGIDEDWTHSELPVVFGLIGSAAIAPIAAFISDEAHATFPAATAIMGVKEIAQQHAECRSECISVLERTLERKGNTDSGLKGFAVSALIDLEAVEAIEVIRRAFRLRSVDLSIVGDIEDVEIAMHLRAHRATPAPSYHLLPVSGSDQPGDQDLPRRLKVGRNDPCPCGSGKKYKKCCLA